MPRIVTELSLKQYAHRQLNEYVTAVSVASSGLLAAASASGEVVLWLEDSFTVLLESNEKSIDTLCFSFDGSFLAAAGQAGIVYVWQISNRTGQLLASIDCKKKWLEHLAWSPEVNYLAFGFGRYAQIWQFPNQELITTIHLEESNVLGLAWRPPLGSHLTIAHQFGVKIWDAQKWDEDPISLQTEVAVVDLAWSSEGRYLAVNRIDKTASLFEWGNTEPWFLHGFLGKIRKFAWSDGKDPLLAMSTVDEIVVWKRSSKPEEGWSANVLKVGLGNLKDIAFASGSELLAAVSENGSLTFWLKNKQIAIVNQEDSYSCLHWFKNSQQLITGSQNGNLTQWRVLPRGRGFA